MLLRFVGLILTLFGRSVERTPVVNLEFTPGS